MKLLVLSDLHLIAPGEQANDLGNHARLEAAIDRINSAHTDADLVVLAGDLVDRGRAGKAIYEELRTALTRLRPPHALTIGNHDLRRAFVEVFGDEFCDEAGFVQSARDLGETRVIVLDSVSDRPAPEGFLGGDPGGEICAERLGWLEARLSEARGRPVILVLHHPVLPVGIQMDEWALATPGALLDLLSDHGGVRQVIAGHIHMTTTTLHRGIAFTTIAGGHTTSVESFGAGSEEFRRMGPAQMAVVLSNETATTVHFDNYVDHHERFERR